MIVSGLPERNGNQHVREIANVALDILENVLTFRIPHKPDRQLQLRIGILNFDCEINYKIMVFLTNHILF